MGNLSETSGALRKFCLKFSNGFSCRTPMKKANVVVFRLQLRGGAEHAPLAVRMGVAGVAPHLVSLGTCDGSRCDPGRCLLKRLIAWPCGRTSGVRQGTRSFFLIWTKGWSQVL